MLLLSLLKDDQKKSVVFVMSRLKCLIDDASFSKSLFPSMTIIGAHIERPTSQDESLCISGYWANLMRRISLVNLHFTSSLIKEYTFIVIRH